MADWEFQTKTDITQSDIGSALGAFPAAAKPYAVYKGYLYGPVGVPVPAEDDPPATEPQGVYLLYLDDAFSSWLTIEAKDVVAHITPAPNPFDTRGKVWVSHNARVVHSRSDEAHAIADDVTEIDPGGGPTRPPGGGGY